MRLDPLAEIRAMRPIMSFAARNFILPRFKRLGKDQIVRDGRPENLVTLADIEASRHILKWCRQRLPGSFSEEEADDERFEHETIWCIDPLDGTEEFRQGKAGFCIQASLLSKDGDSRAYRAAGGIIYHPLSETFLYATKEFGPVMEKNGLSELIKPAGKILSLRAAVREVDPGKRMGEFIAYAQKTGLGMKPVRCGGAGHTVMQMLCPQSSAPNVFIFNRDFSKEWDISPSANSLERAGWSLCDLEGQSFLFNRQNPANRKGFVIAPKARLKALLEAIRSFGVTNLLERG